jgi:single-stranded DNA-binding protein
VRSRANVGLPPDKSGVNPTYENPIEQGGHGEGSDYRPRQQQGRPAGAPAGARQSAPPQQDNGGFEDDDIPF